MNETRRKQTTVLNGSNLGAGKKFHRCGSPGRKHPRWVSLLGLLGFLNVVPVTAEPAPSTQPGEEAETIDGVPPRLSYTYGEVSFWRPGAEEWTPAQVNTPLAPGDALFSTRDASVEVQIGARAFIRAGSETELVLSNREPNYVQFEVTTGQVALDARSLEPGLKVEFDTPNAAFTVEVNGYYRIDVAGGTTTFVTRHGGRATMLSAAGVPSTIGPGERRVVSDTEEAGAGSFAAPDLDAWDRWNYERTDHLIDTASARYVSPEVYGLDELDRYGTWHDERDYGPVWIPSSVGHDWAPYTVGRWIWDPFYGWTWIDAAPWGWAPCHYGRWVRVRGYWGWAPGPVIVRPVYAPAVVAFFGGSHFSVGLGFGWPAVGWVALGWGEPIVPWWGGFGFVGVPWWGGWGGPYVVNNIVIKHKTIIHAHNIHKYRHGREKHALGYDREDRFGRGPYRHGRSRDVDSRHLRPIHGKLPMRPVTASLTPRSGRGAQPPDGMRRRPVVATRPARDVGPRLREAGLRAPDSPTTRQRVVSPARAERREEHRARSGQDRPVQARTAENGHERTRRSEADRPDRLQRARPSMPAAPGTSPRNVERPAERDRPVRMRPHEDRSTGIDRAARPRVPRAATEQPSARVRPSRPEPPARRSEQPRRHVSERPPAPQLDESVSRHRLRSRPDTAQPAQNPRSRVQRDARPSRRTAATRQLEQPSRQARPSAPVPRIEQPSASPRTRLDRPRAAAPQAARPRAMEPSRSQSQPRREGSGYRSQPSYSSGTLRSSPSWSYGRGGASMGSSRGSAPAGGGRMGNSRSR